MPDYTKQYKPIAASMTASNVAMSVRFARTMADNINNYCLYVGNHKIIGQPCVPEWISHDSTTDERVILPFAARGIPDGFRDFLCVMRHYRREGSDSTTWRLYCSRWAYAGDVAMDTSLLSPDYSVVEITSSSQYLARSTGTLEIVRGTYGGESGASWLVLTAQNGDASTRSALVSMDVWPRTATTEDSVS